MFHLNGSVSNMGDQVKADTETEEMGIQGETMEQNPETSIPVHDEMAMGINLDNGNTLVVEGNYPDLDIATEVTVPLVHFPPCRQRVSTPRIVTQRPSSTRTRPPLNRHELDPNEQPNVENERGWYDQNESWDYKMDIQKRLTICRGQILFNKNTALKNQLAGMNLSITDNYWLNFFCEAKTERVHALKYAVRFERNKLTETCLSSLSYCSLKMLEVDDEHIFPIIRHAREVIRMNQAEMSNDGEGEPCSTEPDSKDILKSTYSN